jgi:hypothetical protein
MGIDGCRVSVTETSVTASRCRSPQSPFRPASEMPSEGPGRSVRIALIRGIPMLNVCRQPGLEEGSAREKEKQSERKPFVHLRATATKFRVPIRGTDECFGSPIAHDYGRRPFPTSDGTHECAGDEALLYSWNSRAFAFFASKEECHAWAGYNPIRVVASAVGRA